MTAVGDPSKPVKVFIGDRQVYPLDFSQARLIPLLSPQRMAVSMLAHSGCPPRWVFRVCRLVHRARCAECRVKRPR